MTRRYRYFDHEADIGIEARGKTVDEAFANAALGMFAIMAEPATVLPEQEVAVEFEEADLELALVTWLNQLLAQARLRGLVFCAFELEHADTHWLGRAWGMPWRPGAERGTEVKGATLTMLKVEQGTKGWLARCIVDV
ncbi:SHS2 domain-containing protein [Sulfuritortus calidifontis]|uniref:SHS2 domain-containing protein n=2 Tax=Sulfuritortus calidifontis TaxID=1914471 RepID=A0A4R3JX78_9PROT|nr:archease [Sulfuritortus calidifontis]TCS72988.1 SHS2 domain-containing protein [Sulfuritortus calidifontis]